MTDFDIDQSRIDLIQRQQETMDGYQRHASKLKQTVEAQQQRITELLRSNNGFEQRAREAERERDAMKRRLDWIMEALAGFEWRAKENHNPDPDPIRPHVYCPDYQAQGDCRVCGHGRDAPWHETIFETLCPVPEARRNADDMGLPPGINPSGVLREDGT